MLISINIASTRLTKHTRDVNKAEDKALAYTEEILIRIHITEDIYTKKNTKKAKEIKDSNKRSATFVINKTANQQSILLRNIREYTKGFANKLYT
jgi:hypothetical protein